MPYSISDRVQSLPERILPGTGDGGNLGRMDPVLFVRPAAQFQSMVVERVEDVRGFQSSSRSWLRSARGNRARRPKVAAFRLGFAQIFVLARPADLWYLSTYLTDMILG
jgi:hypothetical protein